MQILISCAKTMKVTNRTTISTTRPIYENEALRSVRELMTIDPHDLEKMLHVNPTIAQENHQRYGEFLNTQATPALAAYTGIVFQQIDAQNMTEAQWEYANKHLFITSFLYGLLRPTNGIKPYRLEGNCQLVSDNYKTRFEYWQPLLTNRLIDAVKADDGILINLASAEMKKLFDWKRVANELQVVTPNFMVDKGNKLRTIVVYAKMCRGQMTKYILNNQLTQLNDLKNFSWNDFNFVGEEHNHPLFVLRN